MFYSKVQNAYSHNISTLDICMLNMVQGSQFDNTKDKHSIETISTIPYQEPIICDEEKVRNESKIELSQCKSECMVRIKGLPVFHNTSERQQSSMGECCRRARYGHIISGSTYAKSM
jgi:hypothetical protein